jgi:hypothetical protein
MHSALFSPHVLSTKIAQMRLRSLGGYGVGGLVWGSSQVGVAMVRLRVFA